MADSLPNAKTDIDLLEVFSNIWKFIVRFFRTIIDIILFLFVFGFKRAHWMLLIVLLGFGVGYLVFNNSARYYSSEMIAQPNGFTSIDMAYYINDVHEMCIRRNKQGLANALEVTEDVALLIKDINAYFFIDVNEDGIGDLIDYEGNYNPSDSTQNLIRNRILIRAEVFDNSIFETVKNGLVRYIEKNSYLIKVNDLRKRELQQQINLTNLEIQKLDSLQNFEYFNTSMKDMTRHPGQILFMNEKSTQLYYKDKESLLERRISYQKALELASDPITIIKEFAALQTEENPLLNYLLRFGIVLALLGYLFLLIFAYRKKVFSYLASKA